MYLLGFSLNNLSLMALTISTGFVVDDAIVVLENVTRHLEEGMPRVEAALRGAREVGFTVVSISLSLVAVFLPLLLMGGIVGRLFKRVHGDAVDGGADFDGRVADDDADDVRADPAAPGADAARPALSASSSARSTRCSTFYRSTLRRRAAPSLASRWLFLLRRSGSTSTCSAQCRYGFFPVQDTGLHDRLHPGAIRASRSRR